MNFVFDFDQTNHQGGMPLVRACTTLVFSPIRHAASEFHPKLCEEFRHSLHSLAWNSLVRHRGRWRMGSPCSPRQGLHDRASNSKWLVTEFFFQKWENLNNPSCSGTSFLLMATRVHSNGLSYSPQEMSLRTD